MMVDWVAKETDAILEDRLLLDDNFNLIEVKPV